MAYQTVQLSDFAGLNQDESPERLAQNDLVIAQNVARNGSSFGTRPGTEREAAATGSYSAALAGATTVQGGVEYARPNTAGVRMASTQLASTMFVISNGKCYSDSGTEITQAGGVTISAPGTSPNLWTFAQHKGVLYMAGGQNGDTVNYWSGGNVTAVTFQNSSAVAIDAKYVFQKWNYGFLSGMNGTTADDNPMVVRYSPLGDMTSWPAGNTIGGTSTIGGFDSYGDNWTTGFADYTDNDGDWLLCLTRRQIYGVRLSGNPFAPFFVNPNGIVANGCVHQNAYVSLGVDSGDAVYLSENGIHSMRQSQQHGAQVDTFLSWKIRDTFANLNKLYMHNACGCYWPEEGLVLFAVPYLSSQTNNIVLALDIRGTEELTAKTARWYIWNMAGFNIASMWRAKDTSGNNRIYFGTYTGDVMRFTRAIYADDGDAYHVHWRTKDDDYERHDRLKCFGDIYPSVRPGGQYKPQMALVFDRGTRQSAPYEIDMPITVSLWGTAVWGTGIWSELNQISTEKQYGEGCGYTLGLEFQHSGSDEPFFMTKLTFEIAMEGESAGDV